MEGNAMSDLTFLFAICFLVVIGYFIAALCAYITSKLSEQILSGVVRGSSVSPQRREAMLIGTWLPIEVAMVAYTAFFALAALEMANHVSGANVKLLAQLAAFLAGTGSAFIFVVASIAFFHHWTKLRRDKQRQAEAD